MKNLKTLFRSRRSLIATLIITSAGFAQPVVKVPPLCEVVVAGNGAGAVTGFGGAVGDGGIVVMPDPFDYRSGEGDFYFASNGSELIGWSLLGDLSMQTDTEFDEVLQPVGPINPVNLQSYNKNLRPAESASATQPTFDRSWARSKGRVIVFYGKKECKTSMKFEIYKRYPEKRAEINSHFVPPISGSDCVLPNTVYTYSVDRIASDNADDEIGFDKYYWSGLPEDSVMLYTSGDNSAITFTTGNSTASFTLQCCYGRANAWDGDSASPTHTTCVTKQVGGRPAEPLFEQHPPECLNTGESSFTVTINPQSIDSENTYVWSAPGTNWILASGGIPSGQTLQVSGIDNNPGNLVLTVTKAGCLPAMFNYPINRNYNNSFSISGTSCVSAGGIYSYSLPANGMGNPTIWTAPTGWIITPTNGTASVNVTVPNNAVAGTYTLSAKSNSCDGTTSFPINVRPSVPVFASSTPACVPLSSPAIHSFAVMPISGVTSYTWTLPSGWSCSGNCNSANPSLIPPVNNANFGATAMPPGTLSVIANSGAGCSSVAATFTVNYIRINTNTLQSGAGSCDQYSMNTNASPCIGTISSWTVGGVPAVSNGTTVNVFGNTLTLCGNTAPSSGGVCANIVINGIAYTTCSSSVSTGTHGLRHASPKTVLHGITITPNPNSGRFNIRVADFNESATATLVDFSGNEIQTFPLHKGDNPVEYEGLKKGNYFVILVADGKQDTRQILVK